MGQPRVAIGEPVFEPRKIAFAGAPIEITKALRKQFENAFDVLVRVKGAQVLVDSEQRIRPGSWAGKGRSCIQCGSKQVAGQTFGARVLRSSPKSSERPQRPPLAIFRATVVGLVS